jgi:ABC-type multidrug transport system ATPase subunit
VSPPLISAADVVKRYGRKLVLGGVSFHANPGEAIAIVGENGVGKSTLLKICAGLVDEDEGRVAVSGRIGYCPQEPGLLDLLTAEEHVRYFGAALRLVPAHARNDGRRLLAEFGFPVAERKVAGELSGGSRQKLNLVLALLSDPEVLLLDEPYQAFDRGAYVNFWDHVDSWRAQGRAIVVVTHLLAELSLVDRIVELHPNGSIR